MDENATEIQRAHKGSENLRPFAKGDERINRKGRPPAFDTLRALARRIAEEGEEGERAVDLILRDLSRSKVFEKQKLFLEIAYGKVPLAPMELPANLNVKGYSVLVNPEQWDSDGQAVAVAVAVETVETVETVEDHEQDAPDGGPYIDASLVE